MSEALSTVAWEPVAGIDRPCGSMSFSYTDQTLVVVMHFLRPELGKEWDLRLEFSSVLAVRWENECPGLESYPNNMACLEEGVTFPLQKVSGSEWLSMLGTIHSVRDRPHAHFLLVASDDLMQLIALDNPRVKWVPTEWVPRGEMTSL